MSVLPRRTCSRCVMDATAIEIDFDEDGVCNYCRGFRLEQEGARGERAAAPGSLENLVERVRAAGRGKRYDCVVGVSGGLDSSWTLVRVAELGLRPLAVHMDNGWNSELAQNNVERLVRGLGVDLYTHVIEWQEYRGLMQAFLDADVIDVELLYDNAMRAVNYRAALRYRLRHILGGTNSATEGMRIPRAWNWIKTDVRNIKAISRRFGGPPLRSFPSISTFEYGVYRGVLRIQWVDTPDYFDYTKEAATRELEERFGFKRYPYKHYESIFTRFYQGYLLPEKFGVDKRRIHLSNLIMSGQIDRETALGILEQSPYPSQRDLDSDIEFFLKKMGWSQTHLNEYLVRPAVPHDTFPNDLALHRRLTSLLSFARNRAPQTNW